MNPFLPLNPLQPQAKGSMSTPGPEGLKKQIPSSSMWKSEGLVIIQDDPGRLLVRDSVSTDEANQRFLRLQVSQD